MKRSNESLKSEILKVMKDHDLYYFPSRQFLEGINRKDLFNAVSRSGGFLKVADDLGISKRKLVSKWTMVRIENELVNYVKENKLQRMPSKPELINSGRSDLGNILTRRNGMEWWSNKVGLPLKKSETTIGNKYERQIEKTLVKRGYSVREMTVGHPYDLLVNENVKIDVKVSSPGRISDWRCHTFRPSKANPTCDLYVCVAIDEVGETEKIFVIPSNFAKVTTLCIGGESKYNKFIGRWDFIDEYTKFYDSLTI